MSLAGSLEGYWSNRIRRVKPWRSKPTGESPAPAASFPALRKTCGTKYCEEEVVELGLRFIEGLRTFMFLRSGKTRHAAQTTPSTSANMLRKDNWRIIVGDIQIDFRA